MALLDGANRRTGGVAADTALRFEIDVALAHSDRRGASLRGLVLELVITTDDGRPLLSLMNVDDSGVELPAEPRARIGVALDGPTFVPGRYRVNVFLGIPYLEHVDEISDALEFEILPPESPWRPYALHDTRGIICRQAIWTARAAAPAIAES